jgi:type IV secretory pathway TraG/TraD family ATPase VirD4
VLKELKEKLLELKFAIEYYTFLISIAVFLQLVIIFLIASSLNLLDKNLISNIFLLLKAKLHIVQIQNLQELQETTREKFFEALKFPFLISLIVYPLVFYFNKKFRKKVREEQIIKGAKLLSLSEFIKKIKKYKSLLKIGGFNKKKHILTLQDKQNLKLNKKEELEFRKNSLPIPFETENKHFFVIGAPGSGKTLLLNEVLEQLKLREEKVIVHDFKGDFVDRFYNPVEDLVFNPIATDGIRWSIFNDINNEFDIDFIAASIVPQPTAKEDPFWKNAARDVLVSILKYCYRNDLTKNSDIFDLLKKSNEEIAELLEKNGFEYVVDYIKGKDSKQAQSVMATLKQHTKFLEILQDGDFSIKDYLRKGKGFIFLQNTAAIKDTISPALTLFLDVFAKNVLSLKDNLSRRIFFILDEFGMLNRLNSIVDLLTNGRSKGASVWLTVQDIGQINNLYGDNLRQTIMNACNNYFCFKVNDYQTAELLSKKFGEVKIKNIDEMVNHSASNNLDMQNANLNRRISEKIEKIILPSELQSLNERELFVSFSIAKEITKAKVYIPR